MKIAIAQFQPERTDINANIEKHKTLITLAASLQADALFFPELSLTCYETELARQLAIPADDERLDVFEGLSKRFGITIGLGIPTPSADGLRISMVVFQPEEKRQVYSKQMLHEDELPYFVKGEGQLMIGIKNKKIAPAICYESLQPQHTQKAIELGCDVYLASVAKSQNGINKAMLYYPIAAKAHQIPVLMSNCTGFCDNFMSVGQSAVWKKDGMLAAQFDEKAQGVMVFDTESESVIQKMVETL